MIVHSHAGSDVPTSHVYPYVCLSVCLSVEFAASVNKTHLVLNNKKTAYNKISPSYMR
jgi:hypothetical protein